MLPQKCATTTLQTRFAEIKTVKDLGSRMHYNQSLQKNLGKHVELKDAFMIKEFISRENYLKACFIRNPYDRAYSWFKWIISNSTKEVQACERNEAVRNIQPHQTQQYEKVARSIFQRRDLLEKINYSFPLYLKEKSKRFIPISNFTHVGRKCIMDFIGRVESFEQDFDSLCQKIDYSPRRKINVNVLNTETLQHEDSIKNPRSIDHYDERSIKTINTVFAKDFRNFNYKKLKTFRFFG